MDLCVRAIAPRAQGTAMGKHEHKHIEASGASLAQAAQTALEQAGEAWTDMRAQLFDAVAHIRKPASAHVLADIVPRTRGKRVGPHSIDRLLELLVTLTPSLHPQCVTQCTPN